MNRYIDRYTIGMFLAVAFLFANPSFAAAQVKLEGGETAIPGTLNKLSIKITKGQDLKIIVFKNGEVNATDWLAMKELDGSPVLLLQPSIGTKSAIYTVVAGVNDGGKTLIDTKVVRVGDLPTPTPTPNPNPNPTPQSTLAVEVVNLYKVNPDPATLDKLITAFQEVKAAIPNLKSYGDYETQIANSVKNRVPTRSPLLSVRDRLGAYILDKTGSDPRQWDAKVAGDATEEVLQALMACK